MWLKFWPHADLKHREVECLAWLSVVQASPGAVHCCIACATSCERQPCKMMKDISDKYPSLCIPLRGVEESSKGSLPPFKSCRILPSSDAVISHKRRLPIIGNSSQKSLPLFKFSMPFSPAIQIVCTDHWSARNWWWTPKHCTSTSRHSVTCILGNQEPFRMIQEGIEVWECCSLELWMIQGGTRQQGLPSLDAAVFRFKFAETVGIAA